MCLYGAAAAVRSAEYYRVLQLLSNTTTQVMRLPGWVAGCGRPAWLVRAEGGVGRAAALLIPLFRLLILRTYGVPRICIPLLFRRLSFQAGRLPRPARTMANSKWVHQSPLLPGWRLEDELKLSRPVSGSSM